MSGYFITFEGGEGVGKTTQIFLLEQYLRSKGYDVLVTREPGGTIGAEIMRHILLSGIAKEYGTLIEAALFTAARADHVAEVIVPALQKNQIILCDRFIDSTRVYQGLNGKVNSHILSILERIGIDGVMPNLTFLLDIPAVHGMKRANLRRKKTTREIDYFEKDKLNIQEQRREAFLQLAQNEPCRFRIIDASCSIKTIAQKIQDICHQSILDNIP